MKLVPYSLGEDSNDTNGQDKDDKKMISTPNIQNNEKNNKRETLADFRTLLHRKLDIYSFYLQHHCVYQLR